MDVDACRREGYLAQCECYLHHGLELTADIRFVPTQVFVASGQTLGNWHEIRTHTDVIFFLPLRNHLPFVAGDDLSCGIGHCCEHVFEDLASSFHS